MYGIAAGVFCSLATAANITLFGIGGAFWGLAAGLCGAARALATACGTAAPLSNSYVYAPNPACLLPPGPANHPAGS